MKIHVVVSGRNYHRANDFPTELELPDGTGSLEAVRQLREKLGDDALPEGTLVAASGTHLGTVAACRDVPLRDGDELVFIAPVAGG
ncbi:hypothetical protein JCM19992_05820 [Thermostilla marina]